MIYTRLKNSVILLSANWDAMECNAKLGCGEILKNYPILQLSADDGLEEVWRALQGQGEEAIVRQAKSE